MTEEVRTVVIDADALLDMTHEEWFAILRLGEGRLTSGLILLLERVVVGGVMEKKWNELGGEIRALNKAIDQLVNPTEPGTEGNSEGG